MRRRNWTWCARIRLSSWPESWRPTPRCARDTRRAGAPLLTREQVFGDATIRVVAVESDVKDHAADARAALEAGKHLHLEKPPAADMKGCREMFSAAARRRLLVQPGYMWRHHPASTPRSKRRARAGWARCSWCAAPSAPDSGRGARGNFRDIAGGQMFELGGHLIDPSCGCSAAR